MLESRVIIILDDHGVKMDYQNNKLMMLECYTQHGEYKEEWIPVIFDKNKLFAWLGY